MQIDKLKIEKGIPLPRKNITDGLSETLKEMEVGDSILLPSHPKNVYQLAIQLKIKVAARKVEGGVRLWRTE